MRYHSELRTSIALAAVFSVAAIVFLSAGYATGPGHTAGEKVVEVSTKSASGDNTSIVSDTTGTIDSTGVICVHVAGHVRKPGIYFIPEGSRVADAVARAIPEPDANLDFLNLAMTLSDGAKIYVPDTEEAKKFGWPLNNLSINGVVEQQHNQSGKIKINLNSCTIEDLEMIPGIGEKTAEKIIELRQKKHGFKSVEELKEVQGIGEKKFEQIREYVYVIN